MLFGRKKTRDEKDAYNYSLSDSGDTLKMKHFTEIYIIKRIHTYLRQVYEDFRHTSVNLISYKSKAFLCFKFKRTAVYFEILSKVDQY